MIFRLQRVIRTLSVLLSVLFVGSLGASVPSYITPCKIGDHECLKTSVQRAIPEFMAGVPDLGVENMNPMHLDTLEYEFSGLKFKLEDGRIKGWKKITVDKVSWNVDEKTIDIEFHSDFLLRGTYTAGGQILVLPITGHGDMKLKTKDTRFKMHIPYEVVKGEDDKKHLRFKTYKLKFEETVGAHYTLTNLFDGNKDLSDAMHNFLNENWRVVTNDFGGPVIVAAIKKLFENIDKFLTKIPLEDIILQ